MTVVLAGRPPVVEVPDYNADRAGYEAFYHAHEEDFEMPSIRHGYLAAELQEIFRKVVQHGWAAMEVSCYEYPRNNLDYLRPDVLVAEGVTPDIETQSYRPWDHGRLLLAVEIASRKTKERDVGPKADEYARVLQPKEYLYFDPMQDELRLYYWTGKRYIPTTSGPDGRYVSRALGLSFGVDAPGHLRVYDRQGRPISTPQEDALALKEAEKRAEIAGERADFESAARRDAERRARAEATARRDAEARSAALEQAMTALKAEMAALRDRPQS
jgi:Uma2 family endonuclease